MGSVPQRTKLSRQRMIEICIELSLSLWLNDILHMERVKIYEAGEKQLPECGRESLHVAPMVWSSCTCVTPPL